MELSYATESFGNESVFEDMELLQKRLRLARVFKALSRGSFSIPLILYVLALLLPFGLRFLHLGAFAGDKMWTYVMILAMAGYLVVPWLVIALTAWIAFNWRCRVLEKRLSKLAVYVR